MKKWMLGALFLLGATFAESGKTATDFKLVDADGNVVALSSLRGKPVVVNFWASWCGPCKAEMPDMNEVYLKHKDKFRLLAVGNSESRDDSLNYFKEKGFAFTVLQDAPNGFKTEVSKVRDVTQAYGVNGIPHSFFIDENGVIQAARIGSMNKKTFSYYLSFIGVETE